MLVIFRVAFAGFTPLSDRFQQVFRYFDPFRYRLVNSANTHFWDLAICGDS